jgi:cell division protein ZapA
LSYLHLINVLGRELKVRSTARPETVRAIEEFVNKKLTKVAGSVKGGDSQVVAIITLMTMAESYLALLADNEESKKQEEDVFTDLIKKINSHI